MAAEPAGGQRLLTDWQCAAATAGEIADPSDLSNAALDWFPFTAPGTVAAALGITGDDAVDRDLDAEDWWLRCDLTSPPWAGPTVLRFEGLATIADVWLDGLHLAHSENMWVPLEIVIGGVAAGELVVRCAALTGLPRRPRPRWKTRLVADQSLRWLRTTLIGRIPGWAPGPAPVGPWRPVSIASAAAVRVVHQDLRVGVAGNIGTVDAEIRLAGVAGSLPAVRLTVGDVASELAVRADGETVVTRGNVTVPSVQRWWPHTHGDQPTYDVVLSVDDVDIPLGSVGFRSVRADRSDDGFALFVNDVAVFARGACWMPVDPVRLQSTPDEVRQTLQAVRDAGMNMVRVTGVGIYEDSAFWDACDELGLLVWQDLMFANLDPPSDPDFAAMVVDELAYVTREWQPRPSLAVVCGGSEVEQQATYFGLDADGRAVPLLAETVPELLDEMLPGVPYVPSTPTGGVLPTRLRSGVTHYYGVGAYLRPLTDVRTAGVRFAAECLAFAIPPESAGSQQLVEPQWDRGTPRDSGADWNFSDVRDHYVRLLYDVDPATVRRADPDRYLDLGRAAVCEAMTHVFSEWRRPGSGCAGGLVLALRDLRRGPGWGLLDAAGRPKAPWWPLRGVLAPRAVLVTDEGLDGILVHLVNDCGALVEGGLTVELVSVEGHLTDTAEAPVAVPGRGGVSVDVEAVLGAFRDVNGAHRFGQRPTGCLVATWRDVMGAQIAAAVHPLAGPGGRCDPELQLDAVAVRAGGGWAIEVSANRYAERVALDLPGWHLQESWFNLVAGRPVLVAVRRLGAAADPESPPQGTVRAVNAEVRAQVRALTGAEHAG